MTGVIFDGNELRVDTRLPMPVPAPGEALVKVTLAGVCRTDQEIVRGYGGYAGVLGHEFVGVVEEAPEARWIGQRVVGEINCPCHDCPPCRRGDRIHCQTRTTLGIHHRGGCMADYLVLPQENLHAVPSHLSDEQAVFAEPLAAAVSVTQRVHIHPEARITVVGDGRLGLLVCAVLRLTGCHLRLVGNHPAKMGIASGMGIEVLPAADVGHSETEDVVVECSGTTAGRSLALSLVRPRGTLVLKGTHVESGGLDANRIVVDEIRLLGSRCGPFAPALRLLAAGLVNTEPLLEGVWPLRQAVAAFARAEMKAVLKILLRPSGRSA
ncbi:MAG: alcohol dehydrogenase catalytic domain-containing protein [Magnetococcales bacterium]|nr:alcohol dehydrogenase catalytic domain-containing protein [Magnetococcales bacterium]